MDHQTQSDFDSQDESNGQCKIGYYIITDDTFDEFDGRKKEVLEWMITGESQEPYGGIIAADMGNIDCKMSIIMDLLLKSKSYKMNCTLSGGESDLDETIYEAGHTLIICSKTKIDEWIVWCQEKKNLDIVCFHDRKSQKLSLESLTQKDIVITTIKLIQTGYKHKKNNQLYQITWDRIILDNALYKYNYKHSIFKALYNLSSICHWALVGTNFGDDDKMAIYSLIKYINYKPLNNFKIWQQWLNKDQTTTIKEKLNHIIFSKRVI